MDTAPSPDDAQIAYAATGDHHFFLLTVNAVLAATIQGGYQKKLHFRRYDIPEAFLQTTTALLLLRSSSSGSSRALL